MTVACGFGIVFESEGHSYEFGIVPGAAQQLNVDWLVMIVKSNREDNSGNAIRRAGCIAPPKTGATAAAIIHADFAQEAGIDNGIHSHVIGSGSIHPCLNNVLT